jgi:hypothetical protein
MNVGILVVGVVFFAIPSVLLGVFIVWWAAFFPIGGFILWFLGHAWFD